MGLLDALGLRPLAGQAKALTPPTAGGGDGGSMPAPGPGAPDDAHPAPKGAPGADVAQLRSEIDADLASVNDLVLGGIVDDAVRRSINDELTKLKEARAKAARITDPKATLAGWRALRESTRALHAKARAARPAPAGPSGAPSKAQREIQALRKRVDGLRPRTDRARAAPEAKFLAPLQQRVSDALFEFSTHEAADDLARCEMAFSRLGATLDALDTARERLAEQRARFVSARDGGVRKALAAKMAPPTLAHSCATTLRARQAAIEAQLDAGDLAGAGRAITDWLDEAKAWADAPRAYAELRSGKPSLEAMKALTGKPGGGVVLDALVEDLPADKTTTQTMTTALEARFGTKVTQFNHRKTGDDGADTTYKDARKETNPQEPQKHLKDLYATLRKVPVRDVRYAELITDYVEESGGGFYASSTYKEKGRGGGDADRIVLYAGGPKNDAVEPLPGAASASELDPDCKLVGGEKVNAHSFFALHEVGHALDDARGVMRPHMAEAGWKECSAAEVAAQVARRYGYDAAYVENCLKGGKRARPKRPASAGSDEQWKKAGDDVDTWVKQSRLSARAWESATNAKANAIGGRVYHEATPGTWVSYLLAARARGIRGYQFRAPGEWFADLYAAFHLGKLGPKHPSAGWLQKLKDESEATAD